MKMIKFFVVLKKLNVIYPLLFLFLSINGLIILTSFISKDNLMDTNVVIQEKTIYVERHSIKDYRDALSTIESQNDYGSRRCTLDKKTNKMVYSQYWGKYQLGNSARETIGISHIPWETFKNNPKLQDASLDLLIAVVKSSLENNVDNNGRKVNYIQKYKGKVINHHFLTESGIIAMAHNCGIEPVKQFLNSNGQYQPKDGFSTSSLAYLSLANYNLNITINEAKYNLNRVLATLK